ncbi:MAG: hypothetical protein ACO1OG_11825 [Devosia sp.]
MTTGPNRQPQWARFVPVVGGAVLLAIGAALLADQLGYALPYRWPFLLLLVPAAAAIADGVRLAGLFGWRSIAALSRLVAGALFAAIGGLLFLRLDTGLILPVLIIVLGVATIVRSLINRS